MNDRNLTQPERMGWGWRIVFVLATLVVVSVPLASLVTGIMTPRAGMWRIPFVAVAVLPLGYNWWLAIRWWRHFRKHGSREGFVYVSGIPCIGNLFAVLGAIIGWGDWWTALPAVLVIALDPLGLPWFVLEMIRTRQF